MQFTINPKTLQKELTFVQGIVERKNTIPVLANILIESHDDTSIRISGTDLDTTIRATVAADEIKARGGICVQARKLFDIARLLPDAPVTFKKENNDWVTVTCGRSHFRLPGIATDTFPDLPGMAADKAPDPSASNTPFAITSALLKTLINKTIFAITQEEGRYTLSGAKFEVSGDGIKIITTDGHRLALINAKGEVKNPTKQTLELLIPKKTLSELVKLTTDFDGDVTFGADENHVYFQVGTRNLISRLLAGQFPNYEMVLPKNNDKSAIFDTSEFSKALRRVTVMADDRSHAVAFTFQKEKMIISAQNADEGEANESLTTEFDHEELAVGFNSSYVQDFLNVVGTEKIVMELKDGNSQVEFKPVSDNDGIIFSTIVMPVRLA
jgi:DNA polymerase-3 subunit beta